MMDSTPTSTLIWKLRLRQHFDAWALDDLFGLERGEHYIQMDESQCTPFKRGELDSWAQAWVDAPRCPLLSPEEKERQARNISRAKTGHKQSDETKRKISESVSKLPRHPAFVERMGAQLYGVDNPFYGKKHNDKSRKVMSERAKSRHSEVVAQNKIKVKSALALIEQGLTHAQACDKVGINRNTFRRYLYNV